jgi:serine/threonine protein kinase
MKFLNFQGHFGDVYLANWGGTKVAAKLLKDTAKTAEFEREAEVLSKLRHPRILHPFSSLFRNFTEITQDRIDSMFLICAVSTNIL